VERPKKNLNFYVESVDDLIETSLQEFSRALSRAEHFLIKPEGEMEGEHA
jgi:hypothetical protein